MPQVAQKFVELPKLTLCSPCATEEEEFFDELGCDEFVPHEFGEDEAVFFCQECEMPIVKVNDILSTDYRIMTGSAYLTSTAYNVQQSDETHEVQYTTGQYTVRNVSCVRCSLQLGITYVDCVDPLNEYKIGNFLVGQHYLIRPSCCLLRTQPEAELPTPLCLRCERTATRGVLELVDCMTLGLLSVCRTRRLYELLLRQNRLDRARVSHPDASQRPEHRSAPGSSSHARILRAGPQAPTSWCLHLHRAPSASACRASDPCRAAPHRCSTSMPMPCCERASFSPTAATGLQRRGWQDTLKDRLGMLRCLRPAIQEQQHLDKVLTSMVRFIGSFCRVAQHSAPLGSCGPERVPALLQLLPALVVPGTKDACRSARALGAALNKEWVDTAAPALGDADSAGSPTDVERGDLVGAISAWALDGCPHERWQRSLRLACTPTAGSWRGCGTCASRMHAGSPRTHGVPRLPPPTPLLEESSRHHRRSSRLRSRSQPAVPPPAFATTDDLPHFAPPTRQPERTATAVAESPPASTTGRDAFPQAELEAEPAHPVSRAMRMSSHPADEDSTHLCCLACGAPAVKIDGASSTSYQFSAGMVTSRSVMSSQDPNESGNARFQCACRHELLTGTARLRSQPPQRVVVTITRRLLQSALTARSWAPVQQTQPLLQVPIPIPGDVVGGRAIQMTTATSRQLPLRVLLPSRE